MKRLLLTLSFCLLLTGCLDLDVNVKIGNDWNGDVNLNMEMLDQMFQMVLASQQGAQDGQGGMDTALFDEEKLRALVTQQGGQLRKYENKLENGIRKIHIAASAPDVRKLFNEVGGQQMALVKKGDLWEWNLLDNESMNTFAKMEDEILEQQLNMLLPSLSGLKLKMNIQVPDLVETNLVKEGNAARFELDFDRDIAGKQGREAVTAFKQLLSPKFVKFKGPKG